MRIFYHFQTFCVISKKYKKNYIYRYSCSKSLFLFGPLNPLRKLAIYIITHQWFDILIILTILSNCVTLGMQENRFVEGPPGQFRKTKGPYDATLNLVE